MELKRLLTRATTLLLQGAYQGAESFIEQAMAEAGKLKSELSELETLRTRVTEMAAEVERLQSAIDEANAQDPCFEVGRHGKSGDYFVTELKSNVKLYKGMRLFARPIPAQQSPAVVVTDHWAEKNPGIADQLKNEAIACRIALGFKAEADDVSTSDLTKKIESLSVPEKPEFNGWYCAQCQCGVDPSDVTYHETHTACGRYITDDVPPTSPRITEQDAREIIEDYIGYCDGKRLKPQSPFVIGVYLKKGSSALLNKLNGDHNSK